MKLCRITPGYFGYNRLHKVTLGYNTRSYLHEAEVIYMKTHTPSYIGL